MILSIVTGTFNRLTHLKIMAKSVKDSIPPNWIPGKDYEFCLCDGGSTDGTIEWIESQPGFKLVKHTELLGGIKAFNDAAAIAIGDYLLIANDDVEIMRGSVAKALAILMDDEDAGCVCFYQNRGDKPMHVETIPVYKPGSEEQHVLPYMQVGIVPRFLWEKCGGWGDGAWGSKTYGGDTYLSMRIYESGYKVIAVGECQINDKTVEDGLRTKNYAEELSAHASGRIGFWGMFPKIVAPDAPIFPNPLPRLKRVLYAPIIEINHVVQKAQKCGLRDALDAEGLVWEADYVYSRQDVAEAAEWWNPHLTVTQFHDEKAITKEDVGRIKRATKGHIVNWVGDVWPDQQLTPKFMDMLRMYDYHLVVNATLIEKYAKVGINAAYWQNSAEPQVFPKPGETSEIVWDVIFLGNCYSPYRADMATRINAISDKCAVFGRGYESGVAKGESLYDYEKTGKLYRTAKIIIADNQYLEATGFASDRLFMSLASGGGMLMHQKVNGMDTYMGLVDGLHYVSWDNFDDLIPKVRGWLEHDSLRQSVAKAGHQEFLRNHTYQKRVQELKGLLAVLAPRKNTISACLIVKNEEENIDRVLVQLDECMDEIVVVDTGSTDSTMQKISEFKGRLTPRLSQYEWCDDFSEARNFAKRKCSGDFIFWMDGDDTLSEELVKQLKRMSEWKAHKEFISNPMGFRFPCLDGEHQAFQVRLFRNLPNLNWTGRLHEMVDPSIREIGGEVVTYKSLYISHKAGDEAKCLSRFERNMRILNLGPDGWVKWHYKAQSYANIGRFADAYMYEEKAFGAEDLPDEYRDWLMYLCGEFCRLFGDDERAIFWYKKTPYPDALFRLACLEGEKGKFDYNILRKFLASPLPTETPTAMPSFIPDAKTLYLEWLEGEIEAIEKI